MNASDFARLEGLEGLEALLGMLMGSIEDPRDDVASEQKEHVNRPTMEDWTGSRVIEIALSDGVTVVLNNMGTGKTVDNTEMADFEPRIVSRVHTFSFEGHMVLPIIGEVALQAADVQYKIDVDYEDCDVAGMPDIHHSLFATFVYTVNGEEKEISLETMGSAYPRAETEPDAKWCPVCEEMHETETTVYSLDVQDTAILRGPGGEYPLLDEMLSVG